MYRIIFLSVLIFCAIIYAQPTNLSLSSVTSKSISLSWNSTNASKYQVFVNDVYIQTTSTNSYTIYNLDSYKLYKCQVSDSGGTKSDVLNVTTLPFKKKSTQIDPYKELVYVGAFKLPETKNNNTFAYSNSDIAYRPDGDPANNDDFHGIIYWWPCLRPVYCRSH
jgi:hypothetical protein